MLMHRFVVGLSLFGFLFSLAGCNGPLPFMSGGMLSGEPVSAPAEWNLENEFGVAQLETRPEDPYSVNIAYTILAGRLYINAGDTETEWVKHMDVNPLVRLRIDDKIYLLQAVRVEDSAEIAAFGGAWTRQGMFHRDPFELEQAWVYRVEPR